VIRAISALGATLPRLLLLLLLFAEGDDYSSLLRGYLLRFAVRLCAFLRHTENTLVATLKNSPNSSRSAEALTLRSRKRIFLNCSLRPASLCQFIEKTQLLLFLKPCTRFPGNEKKLRYVIQKSTQIKLE